MDTVALLDHIETAFPQKPLPAMSLRQALLADQSLSRSISAQEWSAERLKDGNVVWSEITDESLRECIDGLAHLDEEAFAYYLGAFLRFGVKHVRAGVLDREGDLLCSIVFSVTSRSNFNLGRLKALSDAQIECVIEFLTLVAEQNEPHHADASKALTRYWLTPEAKRRTIVYVP